MGVRERQQAVRAMRGQKRPPGRLPVARREHRQQFWEAIGRGLSSEGAAVAAGVSSAVGTRWFRHAGGMPSISLAPVSGRYLSFVEREDIAVLHAQQIGVREIASRLGRDPSTILAGSLGVTPRVRRTALSTGPPRPSGMPKGARVAPKCPSWLRTSSCESTSEIVLLA